MTLKPNLLKAFLIGGVVFLFSFLIRFASFGTAVFTKDLYIYFLYCMLYSVVLYVVNASLFVYLDKVFEGANRFSARRIFIGFISSFFISLFVIFILRIFTQVVIERRPLLSFLANEDPANYIESSVITFIVLLIFHALHFYKLYQENKVIQQKIIAGTANAKFESLKNQIDPHFLFNSLNVLSSLIEENPDNAQRFTTSLSKIYRYVLEQKDKELVSVEDELSFAKTYMNLLKMRFENSLFYELPAGNINPDAKVVPLSLQLLLENTVKHNVVSEQKPLHIRIFIDKDYLVIQNDLQKKEVLQDRQGVGLQNIVNRYGIITDRKVLIEQDEKNFSVKIPILTKQIAVMDISTEYNDEAKAYYRAKKRVEELKGFYGNVISYLCVIPFLVFINLKFSPGFQWFWFSALGWGFGVAMHAFKVFGYSSDWEERKIREILEKENNQKTWK
ncbi:histidine kinase [Flavobacterium sp. WLB]|uniref:histidine kinase n=1 Tax=Flavobacterium TaxID=237 RepID=UPI0006ABD0A3|nr:MULTISPECIES: histidine kinase [Flavobacterium]KOP36324.1 histidine kinase [Flavobacterium sp. VMW]OWU90401.1 histidine kinase [Flavobacterium sp. NLM]PUU68057.1 histidine kinase [Flavobacterium sp. WLB]UUF14349.1 histidine kinase [Flavobacterium panici]